MRYFLVLVCFLLLGVYPTSVLSDGLDNQHTLPGQHLSASTTEEMIQKAARKYGVNASVLTKTLECESAGFQDEQSQITNKKGPGGKENSWGIAQINLGAHKEVTINQALNVAWSINYAAYEFSIGNEREWTCYRDLVK